ncbi:Gfo/Idh/MocA family protein [Sulfitobacter guttiformis]|uniref:Putative dehydrogenase n=1 Tax=Sulfitobacter guttiformis TaxID=74349 RepID=A0A420DTM6_9RHOB|nr:Gfo/Idh/MocA family oxidoreductase [Sulfitobacter guttiformis]KIN71120.1 Oxidoreductase family, NAD-binding Rossmann fold protein [Sulfitobacter guttiformis KCTC 32187]RKE97602.1 putative dehydrogenase [Sulfitobacter guttiformis]
MSVKTAIIGLGIMGRRMTEHMALHPGFTPVALWDPDPAACRAAQPFAPEARIVATPEEAIAAAELVYLACPPVPRKAYALAAADAGKALFLEKPLGIDIAESKALVAHLEQCDVPAAINFTQAAGAALTDVNEAARAGTMGDILGADIVVTYAAWPREWQKAADWLKFRSEGGPTREVISHFLFFAERILGPLSVVLAHPSYPPNPALCETQMLARLETHDGRPVSVMVSVGGAQPDRQELTIKGSRASRRISEFYIDEVSDGGPFTAAAERPKDPRATSLKAQLDDLLLCLERKPNRLATPQEALRVQILIEQMLAERT